MCRFKPFNKHLLVERIIEEPKSENEYDVLIPEDFKQSAQPYSLVRFVEAASDCDNFFRSLNSDIPEWQAMDGGSEDAMKAYLKKKAKINLVVNSTMVEEINIGDDTFCIVPQNFVVGVIDK